MSEEEPAAAADEDAATTAPAFFCARRSRHCCDECDALQCDSHSVHLDAGMSHTSAHKRERASERIGRGRVSASAQEASARASRFG